MGACLLLLHRDSALACRRRYPTHGRRVALEPKHRSDAPCFPRYLHCLRDRAEGCTGTVHRGYMVEECMMVHDECKRMRLGEVEVPWVYLYAFDQDAE